MFQDFRVSTIDTDLISKSVTITCSMDIDPDTVTSANIELYDSTVGNNIGYTAKLSGKIITLELIDWPKPNVDYVISIQSLETILGDVLVSGIRRKIIFESSICSKLEITYPAYDEVLTDLRVTWNEVPAKIDDPYINSYYIEISTDNGFHNLIKEVEVVDRTDVDLSDLSIGQYYVRGRVQKDEEYGSWSDIITFLTGTQSANPGPIFNPDDDGNSVDDIYVPDIEILSTPENGETPVSILLEFDCDIDPTSIAGISVIRRII